MIFAKQSFSTGGEFNSQVRTPLNCRSRSCACSHQKFLPRLTSSPSKPRLQNLSSPRYLYDRDHASLSVQVIAISKYVHRHRQEFRNGVSCFVSYLPDMLRSFHRYHFMLSSHASELLRYSESVISLAEFLLCLHRTRDPRKQNLGMCLLVPRHLHILVSVGHAMGLSLQRGHQRIAYESCR